MIGVWLSLVENQSGREPQKSEQIDYLFVDMAHGRCKSYIQGTVCNSPILSLVRQLPSLFDIIYLTGTAEGEGLVGPRPHHFFAPPPPLFMLKRKIIKIKKRLETSFFPSIFRYILCIFFNFKPQAFCEFPVLFAVIVLRGRLAPWSNAMPWPPLRFVRQRVLYFQLRQSFLSVL